MDLTTLRAAQAPLKAQYRDQPAAALVTLNASAELDATEIACSVDTGRALVKAGLHPATGGTGTLACSGDLLLQALASCAGVTLKAVATALEIPIESGHIRVEGDLDFRGTLGVKADSGEPVPVGFQVIRISFDLKTEASSEQLATLAKLTERYCVVLQTLRVPARVELAVKAI